MCPKSQKALHELCVEHLSALVSRAELAPLKDHTEPGAAVAAGAGAAAGAGEPLGLSSFQSQDNPCEEAGSEKGSSPRRSANFSVALKEELQHGMNTRGYGEADGRDGCNGGCAGGDAGERVGLSAKPHPRRQTSGTDSSGATSVRSSEGGECHKVVGAFLLPEEEQVQP